MSINLILVMLSQMFAYVQTHQIVHVKCAESSVFQFYLNIAVKNQLGRGCLVLFNHSIILLIFYLFFKLLREMWKSPILSVDVFLLSFLSIFASYILKLCYWMSTYLWSLVFDILLDWSINFFIFWKISFCLW